MMEVKCGKCGKVFSTQSTDQSRTVNCPSCGERVFVPAMLGSIEQHHLPPVPPPSPPRNVLRPAELILVAIIGCVVIFVVLYKFLKPKQTVVTTPTMSEEDKRIAEEKKFAEDCKKKLSRLAVILNDYYKEKNTLPASLDELLKEKLIDEELLSCSKGHFIYLPEEASAVSSTPEESILVCDGVSAAHLGHRNVVTLRFEVRELNEDVVAERLNRQARELDNKKKKEAEELAKAKQRNDDAAKKWEDAQKYSAENNLNAALEVIKTILENYADTAVAKEKRGEIEELAEKIRGRVRLNEVRGFVQRRNFDEAQKKYDELANEVKWLKDDVEKEKENLARFKKALWFRTEANNLESAQAALSELVKDTKDSFWRGMVEAELNSIRSYEEQAEALLGASDTASQKGDHQRALALLYQLKSEFPLSKAAKKIDELVGGISKNAPLAERFAEKTKIMDKDKDAVAAIGAGLTYLATQQNEDGSWTPEVGGQTAVEKEGLTAFLILPFIAEGNTHITGAHREIVKRALGYLLRIQTQDGAICGNTENSLYSHAFALLAIAELYGTTRDAALKDVMLKAVEYAISKKESASGWRKTKDQTTEDPVLTAWMMLALSVAASYDSSIKPSRFANGLQVFAAHMDKEGRIDYVEPKDKSLERNTEEYQTMLAKTAAAAFARVIHTQKLTDSDTTKALGLFAENLPDAAIGGKISPKSSNISCWFFALHLYYQLGALRFSGWWHPAKKALLTLQISEGKKRGAWDASLVWIGVRGGSLFDTALAILALQTKYMHFGGLNLSAIEKLPGKPVIITLMDDTTIEGYLLEEKSTKEDVVLMQKRGESTIERSIKRSEIKKIEPKE